MDESEGLELKLLDPDPLRCMCKFDDLIDIRKEENSAAFEIFVKIVLPPVVRKNYFKVKKYDLKISEFVSIADEAFGLVLLDNNFKKWDMWVTNGKAEAKKVKNKFGQSNTHWASSAETIARYNELYEMIRKARSVATNDDVETRLLDEWKTERNGHLQLKRKFDDITYSTDITDLADQVSTSPMDSFDD